MEALSKDDITLMKSTYSKYEKQKGSMADFKNMVNLLRKNGRKIATEESAYFAKIYIGGSTWCYSDTPQSNEFTKLCSAVSRNAHAFLKNNPEFMVDEYSVIMVSNAEAIKQKVGQCISHFDIKACYWNIAYNKGFINTNTYLQGLANKEARTMALGYLNKRHIYKFYDSAVPKPKEYRKETYMIWHAILKETTGIYDGLRKIVPTEDFYFYNTDGIYCHPKYDRLIHGYFKSITMPYESKKYIITSVDAGAFTLNQIGEDKKVVIQFSNDISENSR